MNSNSYLPLTGLANYRLHKDGRELMLSARMKLKVIWHEAEEGSYRAEVPAIPGCATQGETFEELLQNLYEAARAACPLM